MHPRWYILGVVKNVLFREMSAFQECSYVDGVPLNEESSRVKQDV